ncbi:MAG: sel1 repeat family protein [Proteobacteria bacterium]|nr:sel1 repeat family protein [Pseudomonadota bacterium]
MFTRWAFLIFTAFLFTAAPVSKFSHADFEKGLEAYDQGDYKTALKEWLIDANQGYAEAQYNLGLMYANGEGVSENDAEAVRWYRLAADQGYDKAQYNLGVMYLNGQGVPQDYAEAMRWYCLAADQGLTEAQYNLGVMYTKGEGVPKNYIIAYMWFNLAATQGQVDAAYNKNVLKERLTPEQIAEAQRLSQKWVEEHQ